MKPIALRARYVFPIVAPPITDGVLTIHGRRIVAVGENAWDCTPVDLGNAAILPGLVNAHAHLEFSNLQAPLGQAGMPFGQWLRAVVAYRRQRDAAPDDAQRRYRSAAEAGLADSARCGTAAIGEIATAGWPCDAFRTAPLRSTVLFELLGLSEDRIAPLLADAREHLARADSHLFQWHAGISPHAPYTVHPELLHRIVRLSAATGTPVAMHVAESRQELELLSSGTGPLVDLLEELDAWRPSVIPRGTTCFSYLEQLAQAHRALVVHGNYLSRQEIRWLGERRGHMSVVYCPRSHAYFGHEPYPLSDMLAAGVRVALGTDSLASNPDLSVLEEMRYVFRHHPELSPADILRMGTLNGAIALGLERKAGVLAPEADADFAVIELDDSGGADPHEIVLASRQPISATLVGGTCWFGPVNLPGDMGVIDS